MSKKTYFVGIFTDIPDNSYAALKNVFHAISDGDYEFVHLRQSGAFVLLKTTQTAHAIEKRIADWLRKDAQCIILECGQDWRTSDTSGLNKCTAWLRNHRP